MTKLAIGIDPGKNTGIAVFDRDTRKLTEVYTSNFWGAIEKIKTENERNDIIVVVELPTTKHVWHDGATSKKAIQRTGVNVGSALREAELIAEYLALNKIDRILQRPGRKLNKDMFESITGWEQRTNQHSRDAAMLVYGMLNQDQPTDESCIKPPSFVKAS